MPKLKKNSQALSKKSSLPTLTKQQNEIAEFRRKGMPLNAIRKMYNMSPDEMRKELEKIKDYNKQVVSQFDSNSHIVDITDNIKEAASIIWREIPKLVKPLDKIKAAKEVVAIQEKLVKIYGDLGLIQREATNDRKSDLSINILNTYGKEDARDQISNIINTTLSSDLGEPEPLPDDVTVEEFDADADV
jgi:hypothetical protein